MTIAPYCRRKARTASADDVLRDAARHMEKDGIGFLVVTEGERPVGVLTDRDVAIQVAAEGRDAATTRVGDAMTAPPVTVDLGDSLEDVLDQLAHARLRRLPVVEGETLAGVVSADDLVLVLAREIGGLGDVLVAQLPAGDRPVGREEAGRAPVADRSAEHYRTDVVTIRDEASVAEAVREMREQVVGSVVVVGKGGKAVGLLTDRDVAVRVVAAGLDPARTTASAVMTTPLVSARPDDPVEEVVARMRTSGIRRVPVLKSGRPVGLVAFDDLLVAFGRELDQVGDCVGGEIRRARAQSQAMRMRQELEDRFEEAAGRLRDAGDQTLRALGRELDQVVDRVGQAFRVGRGPRHTVGDLMCTDVRSCTTEDALSEAARILWEHDCGIVPVLARDGSARVEGVVTDRDLCMATYTSGRPLAELQVGPVMSTRLQSVRPEDPISEAEERMRTARVRRLPVVDESGHLRGILSLADLAESSVGRARDVGVGPEDVGRLLAAICRPRTELVPTGAPGDPDAVEDA